MQANDGTPLVYLAEVGELPDGRLLVKYGETDNIVTREPRLRIDYGTVYFIKLYVCTQPHKYEQWLKRQPLFVSRKYTGIVNGHRHEEVMAVTPGELTTIKRFMTKHLNMFDGWTAEQKLEKIRWQSIAEMMRGLPSFTDQEARINAENALAEVMRGLARISAGPKSDGSSEPEDGSSEHEMNGAAFAEPIAATAEPVLIAATAEPMAEPAASPHMFPPPPKRKLGRPPKAKVPPATDAGTPLQRFLDERFEVEPDAKTHVAHVRALHRLWRRAHVNREETNQMVEFFKQRFSVVQEMDEGHDMTCSFYRGLRMRPWEPPRPTVADADSDADADVDAFVREACEPHVMGRARTADLWDAFIVWKGQQQQQQQQHDPYAPTARERDRFITHLKRSFVYHTGVPVTKDAIGAPGFYGLYLNTATAECREVGYNRSPNTHATVLKLDAHGNVADTIASQDAFAHNVAKKSPQHICKELTRCFKNGMKGVVLGDGYCYMRAADHATMLASRLNGTGVSITLGMYSRRS